MKVALSMHSLHRQFVQGEMCIIDFLKYASRLCVKGVEVADVYLSSDEDLPAIQNKLQETGLNIACFEIGYETSCTTAQIKSVLELAQLLGASYVRLMGNSTELNHTSQELEAMLFQAVDSLLPELEDTDLVLCVENSRNPTFRSEHLAELLEQVKSPRVKGCLNLANCIWSGEDPQVALDLLQPHLALVRASDVRIAEQDEEQNSPLVGAVFGLGVVPLGALIERLQAQDYKGWLTLEFSGLEDAYFGIEASLKNLHQLLYELTNKGVSASGEVWPTA